jgi:hypothetical protein
MGYKMTLIDEVRKLMVEIEYSRLIDAGKCKTIAGQIESIREAERIVAQKLQLTNLRD